MKQIRTGVFETNSSSVHSICISKNEDIVKLPEIFFGFGDYGWEQDVLNTCAERASYLWTAIIECFGYDKEIPKVKEYKSKITEMLNSEGIQCDFAKYEIKKSSYDNKNYCDIDGYMDHGGKAREFVEAVVRDKDRLLRYLFSPDSVIYTGNDNESYSDSYKNEFVADAYMWDNNDNRVPNPYHDEGRFEYFEKGN